VETAAGGLVFSYTFPTFLTPLSPESQMDDVVLYLHLGMKNDWENSAMGESDKWRLIDLCTIQLKSDVFFKFEIEVV